MEISSPALNTQRNETEYRTELLDVTMDVSFVPPPDPHIADYIVIAIFLCICMGIGFYYGYQTNKNPSMENYFFGNRRLLVAPVAMSLFVTFMSAISLMGIPADIYVYGINIILGGMAYSMSLIIASVTIVPLLFPLKLTSTYEYLELRFKSKGVRYLGVVIGMLQTVLYMGITLYAPALYWLFKQGGIKSVVWTDVFQCVVMFVGLIAVLIKGGSLMGESHSVVEIAIQGGRLDVISFNPDPRIRHTIWGFLFGMPFVFLPNLCNQSSVQRFSSLPSLKSAYRSFCSQIALTVMYHVILGYYGILMYSYYNSVECDPVRGRYVVTFNQIVPYFVLDVLRSLPGLSGLFISCLFSGTLSTLSSGINALSANTVEDILGGYIKRSKHISQIFAAKIFVLTYGTIVIGLAYAITSMSGSIIQMAGVVLGACGGPLAGLYFLGGMVPIANYIGAFVGSMTALVFNLWIALGAQFHGSRPVKLVQNPTSGCFLGNGTGTTMGPSISMRDAAWYNSTVEDSLSSQGLLQSEEEFFLYDISYTWYGLIGFSLTLLIGIAVSACTRGDRDEPVEPHLMIPVVRKLLGIEESNKIAQIEEKSLPLVPEDAIVI